MMLPSDMKRSSARKRRAEPEIEWREYPLIQSREYPSYCRWAKRYRDPAFRRSTCLLRWDVLTDDLLAVIASRTHVALSGKQGEALGVTEGPLYAGVGKSKRQATQQ